MTGFTCMFVLLKDAERLRATINTQIVSQRPVYEIDR